MVFGGRPAMPRAVGGHFIVFVIALFVVPRHVAPDLASDRSALLAFREAVGRHLPWDVSAATPCGWKGVKCDPPGGGAGSRVTAVKLPGSSLNGGIPAGTVGNLTAMNVLSLRFNAISGGLPPDIGGCSELRSLYLHGNRFTGDIPEGLFSLALLQRLDLSLNRLTGGVSPEFNKLRRLATLYLNNNNLDGTLPADLNLPKLQLFNLSYNRLDGKVPTSLARMPVSAFLGTGLCGGPLAPCANSTPPLPPSPPPVASGGSGKNDKLSGGAIVGIIAGAIVAFSLVVVLLFFLCRRSSTDMSTGKAASVHEAAQPVTVTALRTDRDAVKQAHSPPPMTGDGKKLVFLGIAPDPPYDLEELLHASAEVLGKGVLGTTYRATLQGCSAVLAVKRLKDVHLPEKEFSAKVATLGALHHDSLPPLRAYYYSKDEKLLVFDFVGSGSLSTLLHGNNSSGRAHLDFKARARIALAAARGIAFIHSTGAMSSHGNIKSSNVLVTATHDGAYVTDHGLVQLVGTSVLPKRGAGYRAPEVTDARTVSQKADVYSFGVLVLELLTGKAPAHALPDGDGIDLPRWVRSVVQEEWTSEAFDSSIANEGHIEEELMQMLQLGMNCTEQHPDRRPAMAEVAARLERTVEDAGREASSSLYSSRSVSA